MKLNIKDNKLHVKLNPLEMSLSHRGSFKVPLDHIVSVSTKRPSWEWQVRAPGTRVPFVIKAGSYYGRQGNKEFWQTTVGRPFLTIKLRDWDYDRIVLTLSNAHAWAERINQAALENPR